MKNLFILFLSIALGTFAVGQKMTEGVIVLELSDITSDDPQMAGMLSSMKGGTMETVFNKDQSKTSTKMMGGMVSNTTFLNFKTNESKVYMDMMGNKIALKVDENDSANSGVDTDVDVKETAETKMIKGYKTKKYIIIPKGQEGVDMKIELYVAEDIKMTGATIAQNVNTTQIKGAPLEININAQGMKMSFTTKSISDKLPADAFKEPKGYKEMTMKEFEQMMGGMGF